MKELSIEQKARAYDEALERAEILIEKLESNHIKGFIYHIFPELKESEDEKIRKSIIAILDNYIDDDNTIKPAIMNWLEKQGKQTHAELSQSEVTKTSDQELEPKFKVGDWVILPLGIIAHIDSLNSTDYQVTTTDEKICNFKISKQDNYRLWTIQDAKDGDVLVSGDVIFIFNKIHGVWVNCYCSLHKDGSFCEENYDLMHIKYAETIYPSTKEQRDTLFAKMKEAGYEWDTENKCLTKI